MAIKLTNSYQYLGRSTAIVSTNGKYTCYLLLYGKTSTNRDTGIHRVSIKTVLACTNYAKTLFYLYKTTHNGIVNGSQAFSGTNLPNDLWEISSFVEDGVTYKIGTLIGEGSVDIDCSNGLERDVAVSGYWKFNDYAAYYTPANGTERTVSETVTLSAIPRQAELITAPNFTDGDNPTITYTNPAGDMVDSVEVGIYDDTGYTALVPYMSVSKTGTSYTFNLTDDERETLTSAVTQGNSVAVKFYIKTTIGGSVFIATPLSRTFTIAGAQPVVTGSIQCDDATYALTGSRTTLIKYYSSVTASMTVIPQKGAPIDESLYIIRNGEHDGHSDVCGFTEVESPVFTFSAEDLRGNVGTDTVTADMIEYIKLTCTIGDNRPDALGNMRITCVGDYFNDTFGAQHNTLTVQYRHKAVGGTYSEWANMTYTLNGNRYDAYATFVIPDYQQGVFYTFETRAIDKLTTANSNEFSGKSTPMFHWGENDFVFEVPVEFKGGSSMTVDTLHIQNPSTAYGVGGAIYFGDGKSVSISEPMDDHLLIDAPTIELNGTLKFNGEELPYLQSGIWFPKLSSSAISSYSIRDGWYQVMGRVVTVGFKVKATCLSDNDSTTISISGLPIRPMESAAGGGMCSGAYVSGGFNFQCFVAETNGTITTRVQASNNTSATNLSTSASGCCYRSDGGEITLSGTITYFASA